MESYFILYFDHRNDVTSVIKVHRKYLPSDRILYIKLDVACDIISLLKISYTVVFGGITVNDPYLSFFIFGLKTRFWSVMAAI